MSSLDNWLEQATRRLADDSAAQVRTEIQSHYESAREAAMAGGATEEAADRLAIAALGDAKTANRQYRKVLLTAAEARALRQGNWEARAVCSRLWMRRLLLASIVVLLLVATALFFFRGASTVAWVLVLGAIGNSLMFAAPWLPVYTPSRGRVFRCVKVTVLLTLYVLAFGPQGLKTGSLLIVCLWLLVSTEWRRISIRRKLPVSDWPKQLFL